ncbi:hypothetical protein JCM6882_008566 [Rhodosporidiobolus microsporus]
MTSVHPYAVPRAGPSSSFVQLPSRAPSRNGHAPPASTTSPSLSAPALPSPALGAVSPGMGSRPMMDRMPSTFGDTPIATNSALNKVASASSSIYQNARKLRDRLLRVPTFDDRFFAIAGTADGSYGGAASPLTGAGFNGGGGAGEDANAGGLQAADPVSEVLSVLRLGASLCYLFNQLGHAHQLDVNPQATLSNLKACQRGAAHFIMACKQDLKWPDGDLFAVNELYGQDTNGVVKVVHTVTKLLDLLESQGVLLPPQEAPEPAPGQAGPSDERSLVVREILDSERKYMQDLDVLQDYQRQLQMNDILTQDQIHSLFINLNKLADFQRRFLIGVEGNASLPAEQQRFGGLFLQMEDNFACYEPYCANLTTAQDLAIAENAALSKLSHVLDPVSELAPLLIKPVQRICKYPLLISQLLKNTPTTFPYYDELKAGLESIMRVTDKVNEEKRRKDNLQAVSDLANRVEDWKGHDIASFGELLLQETFVVIKSENEREYNVYLFERIILCCKEVGAVGKKDKKSNSILKRPPSQRINKLQLKGRIFVNNITGASQVNHRSGQYLLEVRWRGDVNEEAFIIKCRTQELLQQWQKAINKAVEEAPTKRRAHHLSASRRSERNLGGPSGIHSPNSQFPNTPMSEYGPLSSSAASVYSYHTSASETPYSPFGYPNPAQPSYPPGHGPHYAQQQQHHAHPHAFGFDDDGADDGAPYEPSESGRSTPASRRVGGGGATRSLPPDAQARERDLPGLPGRPRAQTEDSNSNLINQWRTGGGAGGAPGQNGTPYLPGGGGGPTRGMSQHSSTGSDAGGVAASLRSSASSRQLRSKQSSEWGGAAGGGGGAGFNSQGTITASPAMSYARLPDDGGAAVGRYEEMTPRAGGGGGGIHRQASHGQVPSQYSSSAGGAPPMLRNRSASSPNIYGPGSGAGAGGGRFADSPQLPDQPSNGYGHGGGGGSGAGHYASSSSGGGKPRHVGVTNSGGTIASASSVSTGHQKRFSSSSGLTDRSSATSAHSGSALPYSAGTSPASTGGPPSAGLPPPPPLPISSRTHPLPPVPPQPSANAVRVKVYFGEDTFVVVVLDSVPYADLVDKVLKKIRMCGGDKARVDSSAVRLRYRDEDGDRILITSEEDTAMAFETARAMTAERGAGAPLELVLFANIDGQ